MILPPGILIMDSIQTIMVKQLLRIMMCSGLLLVASVVNAAEKVSVLNDLTGTVSRYTGPSVEDNIAAMDTDKNGFADVREVRAFLEKKHGAGYEKVLFDKWVSAVGGASCSTPFAKEFYSVTTP